VAHRFENAQCDSLVEIALGRGGLRLGHVADEVFFQQEVGLGLGELGLAETLKDG
jgi:hypothetical protein